MSADAKLLPCPFCGGPASFGTVKYSPKHVQEQGWNQDTFHFVSCIKCGVSNCGIVGHDTMILAAELWNHRELIERREADAPLTAREAEPTEDELDEAWKDGFNAGFGEAKLTGQPLQPSDTVAEAAEIERLTKAHDTVCGALAEAISRAEKAEAERDEALAQVAAAFVVAANTVFDPKLEPKTSCDWVQARTAGEVRALTPSNAQAALEAYGREKVREGMQRVAQHGGQP